MKIRLADFKHARDRCAPYLGRRLPSSVISLLFFLKGTVVTAVDVEVVVVVLDLVSVSVLPGSVIVELVVEAGR